MLTAPKLLQKFVKFGLLLFFSGNSFLLSSYLSVNSFSSSHLCSFCMNRFPYCEIIIIIIIIIMILFLKRFSMLNMLNCAVQCQ